MTRSILLLTPFLLLPLALPLTVAGGSCEALALPDLPTLAGGASGCALAASSPGGEGGPQTDGSADVAACAVTRAPTDDVRHVCVDGSASVVLAGSRLEHAEKVNWNYADGFSSSGGNPCPGCVTPPISIHLQSFLGPALVDVYNAGAYSCATTYPPATTYDVLVTCTAQHAPPTGHWECVNTNMAAHPETDVTTVTGTLGCGSTAISATGHGYRNPWPDANGVVGKADQGSADVITCAAHDDFRNSLSDWEVWCTY
ncbi:MAG: hypothetical protein QOE90_3448 [Thermoplasmata archaeon]|jgi:hypothetical protein|nr:hypothetical protein [Thermoplasmata archaeon]